MCMKYVNATTRCYNSLIQNGQGTVYSFVEPFDKIQLIEDNGHYYIRDFIIQTEISILGTDKIINEKNNPISNRDKLHFTLRLTKCDKDPGKRLGIDIDSFEIDLNELYERNELSHACYPYFNTMWISPVKEIEFPIFDSGKYVLKVLVRNTEDSNDDSIQSMSDFTVIRQTNN